MDGLGWQRQRGQQDEDSGMRVALVNPHWSFEGSIYFGCREPHLPLELGCAAALLEAAGHESLLLDGALMGLDNQQLAARVADYEPEMTVVTSGSEERRVGKTCVKKGTSRG